MEIINWDKSYETGHPVVDGQHKNMFSLIDNLSSSISDGKAKLILDETLDRLTTYVTTHFKTEEDLMTSVNYPRLEEHRKEHENLKIHAFKLIELHALNKVDLTATVSQFLSDWLKHHIKEVDFKMVEWIKNNCSNPS